MFHREHFELTLAQCAYDESVVRRVSGLMRCQLSLETTRPINLLAELIESLHRCSLHEALKDCSKSASPCRSLHALATNK